jgi:hypothetical protein
MRARLLRPGRIPEAIGVGALVVVLAVGSCTGRGANRATQRSSERASTSSAPPATGDRPRDVSATLRAAPQSCAGASIPFGRAGPFGELVGRAPAWAGFYASRHGRTAFSAPDAPRTRYGWRIKVLWILRAAEAVPAIISGANSATGEALWLQPTGRKPSTEARLDPAQPGAPSEDPGWLNYPSYLFFPRAGCYELSVRSSAGGWNMSFGFGR